MTTGPDTPIARGRKPLNAYERVGIGFLIAVALIVCLRARTYWNIKRQQEASNVHIIRPFCCRGTVSEIGYIYDMAGDRIPLCGDAPRLEWWIAVPSSGEVYVCIYGDGFRGFQQGDGIKLIHAGSGEDPDANVDEFIVGLHFQEQGKTAVVGCQQ